MTSNKTAIPKREGCEVGMEEDECISPPLIQQTTLLLRTSNAVTDCLLEKKVYMIVTHAMHINPLFKTQPDLSNPPITYRPYSKLGIITGPYFIGTPNPPSPCTKKSAAKLNLPPPPPPALPGVPAKAPCTTSGS